MFKKCHDHLTNVHEGYFQHMGFALGLGVRMIGAGFAAILHGLFPAVFQHTGSETIFEMSDQLKKRMSRHDHHHEQ